MDQFAAKHDAHISGTISCFDRVLFKGHLPLGWPEAMEQLLARNGLLIKDFKQFVTRQSAQLKEHAQDIANKAGRPYEHLNGSRIRKDDHARSIAERDGITEGLVCILAAVEACHTFRLKYGKGRPRLQHHRGKCLALYYYVIDRELGFLHVRISTWFPFTVQVCVNGHNWLARKMDRHGLAYQQVDNAFLSIEDPARAQRFADRFTKIKWPQILSAFARRVNPLMRGLLAGMNYYWVTDQAEYATDVMFRDRASLKGLYSKLLKHATHCFSAEDVLTFLGRKLRGNFQGQVLNDYKKRWPGARIKHRMKENWIKMYDKHGSVLRIETVINHPYEFRVWRSGIRKGKRCKGWYPMAKGVCNLYRYAEVALAANRRYLDALAVVDDPTPVARQLAGLAKRAEVNGRTHRGFNPADPEDLQLFAAVMRGEHAIKGFCNKDIRQHLCSSRKSHQEQRRQSARVSRLLKRLHVRELIARIQRSRRWRVTRKGHSIMTAVLMLHHEQYPQVIGNVAA